ncbi:MAG: MBOAT family protein [Planctomycetes bacterium]|nr:MBOAT family protein [Planctomycetota bacterium]
MQFDSLAYLVLLVLTFGLFHLGPKRLRLPLLLGASLVFYASWSAAFLGLVIWSGLLDFVAARKIAGAASDRGRKIWLVISLVSNLSLLGVFKYANFLRESLHLALPDVGALTSPWHIVLPVGISFYTFQTMSYSIDVYRRRLEPERDFLAFMLYVCFFPQLVAGPIERAGHLLPQLKGRLTYRLGRDDLLSGLALISWGIVKKVALADNLARVVEVAYSRPDAHSGLDLLIATYAFAFQIFFDFSAYSDIARGSAALFGIKLVRNFRLPYLAESPSDFWRRWHVSLSEWIRDYLYVPLGGNRGGVARTLVNLTLTMGLAGLWHGAAWHFVIWGLYHGLLLVLYRLFDRPLARLAAPLPELARKGLRIFCMFQLSCLGWIFFRADDLDAAFTIIRGIAAAVTGSLSIGPGANLALALLLLVFAIMMAEERARLFHRLLARPLGYALLVAGCWIAAAILAPEVSTPFIYFQF